MKESVTEGTAALTHNLGPRWNGRLDAKVFSQILVTV